MKLTIPALIVSGSITFAFAVAEPRAEQGQTTNTGVYTEAQATRGQAAYEACSSCHGPQLEGDGFAPALSGPEFMANWSGTSVGDLFERIRISMPPGQESTVTTKEKADIVAYILKANRFPAGQTELASETEVLKQIKFETKQ